MHFNIFQNIPGCTSEKDDLEVSGGRGRVPGWGEVGAGWGEAKGKKGGANGRGGGLCAAKPTNGKSVTNRF